MAAGVQVEVWIKLSCDSCGAEGKVLRSESAKQKIPMWRYVCRVAVHTDAQGTVHCHPDMDSVRTLCRNCHKDIPLPPPNCETPQSARKP